MRIILSFLILGDKRKREAWAPDIASFFYELYRRSRGAIIKTLPFSPGNGKPETGFPVGKPVSHDPYGILRR